MAIEDGRAGRETGAGKGAGSEKETGSGGKGGTAGGRRAGTGEKAGTGTGAKGGREVKSGKSAKSSKTAHVLSLLTDREDEDKLKGEFPRMDSAAAVPAGLADSDAVAEQVRSALALALQEDEGSAALSDDQPAISTAPEPEPEPSEADRLPSDGQTESHLNQPEETTPPEPQVSEPQEKPDAAIQPPEENPPSEEEVVPSAVQTPDPLADISYVNVMQALVEEKVDKYIRLFGLCSCPRCKIDVMALALTKLPAKYVVVGKNEAIPMLTVYESRYNTMVISQVMWACKKVMDNPRHSL